MDLGLEDKVVLVLGAGTVDNMGQHIARSFAAEKARVVVAGRNMEVLNSLAVEIGGTASQCDITSLADIRALVAGVLQKHGRLDVGINATGYGLMKPFLDTDADDLRRMVDVQFVGPFQLFQELVKAMTNGGSIIQISSATASIMLDDHSPYRGTKAGIDQVIKSIAYEFGTKGIRANSVAPGLTDSPMAAAAYAVPAIIDLFNRETPMGRTGRPEDISNACLFVASDKCFLTGQVVQANGGVTLGRNPRQSEMVEAAARA